MSRILSALVFIILISLSSCEDEIPYSNGVVPEGESLVSATVSFKRFTPLELSRTNGDAIKNIESLWVIVFNMEGDFISKQKIEKFTVNKSQPNTRPDGVSQAEEETGHAEFDFTLKNGKYHIYVVANYDLSDETITSESDLKSIELSWNNDPAKISENAEMFGFFSESNNDKSALSSFDASTVTINGGNQQLHAWIRRAASKLTIVYDGRNLKDNVVIYIKSATIKDIPMTCPLGAKNTPGGSTSGPGTPDPTDGVDPSTVLYSEGETLRYYDGDTEPDDNSLSISSYKYALAAGKTDTLGTHAETAPALFFYENMQPDGKEGTITDKRQDVNGNNAEVSYPDGNEKDENGKPTSMAWKDGRKYGTYVEIKAFYTSDAEGKRSRGDIIYRFMLGKNVTTNYEAERNYHYKLTMKFNGYANDVDFHIDYNVPVPSLHVQPYYISYLYNHSMMFPVTIHAGHNKVVKLQAEIVQNRWSPEGANNEVYYNDGVVDNPMDYQWHGFLSLRKTMTTILNGNSAAIFKMDGNDKYGTDNFKYYYENLRHSREYSNLAETGEHIKDLRESDEFITNFLKSNTGLSNVSPKEFKEADDDEYEVSISSDPKDPISKIYNIKVPMWTRAKQMIKSSGYTGNNPYVAYQRKALVRFTAVLQDEAGKEFTLTGEAPVTQVRRVVNPKGIYRKPGSTEPFHVTMRILPKESSTEFEDLRSEGSWRAYVVAGDKSIVNLNGKSEITGKAGSLLDFNVNFTGKTGHAIIRVEYHNYTCYHLIFVRNGYEKTELLENGAKWHTFNLRTKNEETNNPMDEGSLFKFGNLDYPIDATSNVNSITPWILPSHWSAFENPTDIKLNIATDDYSINNGNDKDGNDITQKKWNEIKAIDYKGKTFTSSQPLGVSGRVATLEDYKTLFDKSMNDIIEYGYGVLYADGATECAKHISAVYGYRYDQPKYYVSEDDKYGQNCGMRGIFVYNRSLDGAYSGRNVFFPIGNSGYGFRRMDGQSQGGDELTDNPFAKWGGLLKYAGRNDFYPEDYKNSWGGVSSVKMRPLFYDLWRRPGAIYWLDAVKNVDLGLGDKAKDYLGWDINYFTFDFYGYMQSDIHKGGENSAAAFVRLVD